MKADDVIIYANGTAETIIDCCLPHSETLVDFETAEKWSRIGEALSAWENVLLERERRCR